MSQPPLPNGLQPSDFYSPGSYTPFESVGFLMRKVLSSILQQADAQLAAAKVPQVLSSVMNAHMAGFSHDESRKLLDMLRRLLANGDAMRAPEGPAPTAGETRPAA
jgi:hypothetical protein